MSMKRYKKEIVKLTAKEILLSIFDLATPFFEADRYYRVPVRKYREQREFERSAFLEKVRYLKKQGLIENFIEGKERYIEITPKGLKRIDQIKFDALRIDRSVNWDGKWRVVIFDIPEERHLERDVFRFHLGKLGFQKVQESVYVYPFECTDIINELASRHRITDYTLIMISDIIQGEEDFIEYFLDQNVLNKDDLT